MLDHDDYKKLDKIREDQIKTRDDYIEKLEKHIEKLNAIMDTVLK